MPKRIIRLLLFGIVLCNGCSAAFGGMAIHEDETMHSQPTETLALTYLYFSESSSYFERVQGYAFRWEDGEYIVSFDMANEEAPYQVPVEKAWADTLNGFISEYAMRNWDGFSGSCPGLLDGTHFFIEMTFEDGTHVQASGYGMFPDRYGKATEAIDAHFMQLLPPEMRDW